MSHQQLRKVSGARHSDHVHQNLNEWPVEFAAQFMEEMVKVLDAATKLAEQLIPKLRDESTRDWKQILEQS